MVGGGAEHIAAVADLVPDIVLQRLAIGQLHGQGLNVAVAADLDADLAARGNFLQHAAQLLGAFDILPVQLQHHVVDLEPDLAGGGIVIDERDDGAAHFLELERLRLFVRPRRSVHAQVAL